MNAKSELVDLFNIEFRAIYGAICNDSANLAEHDEINSLKNKLNTVVRISPLALISIVGPYLEKYSDNIQTRDLGNLLNGKAFSAEVGSRNLDNEDTQIANMMFSVLKRIYKDISVSRRENYIDSLNDLLDYYIEYELLE